MILNNINKLTEVLTKNFKQQRRNQLIVIEQK